MVFVRSLLPQDIDRVAAIESETLSPWSVQSLKKEVLIQGGIQCVAESQLAGIVGWSAIRIIPPESELLKISVEKNHRGKGVASSLLAWLTSELVRYHVRTMFLEVRSQNYAALKLYHKSGFKQIGERTDYYADPLDNALVFQKYLSIQSGC